MRIAILTQPLGHNYGGLLQAFALQKHLKDRGYTVETLDRRMPSEPVRVATEYCINTAKFMLGRIATIPTQKKQARIHRKLADFRDRHITLSERIDSEQALRAYYRKNFFDVFVVGSDQVWRPRYSPGLTNYFLDFLDDIDCPALRMSYAASFGVDNWEFSPEETARCRDLLGRFDAVSVREQSGVELCERHLGRRPECTPDPTFLLGREEYEALIDSSPGPSNQGKVLSYLLDTQAAKQQIVHKVVAGLGKGHFTFKPQKLHLEVRSDNFEECRYPGVGAWLKGFRDASFVVTDSFHGTVFAILFNKPFISLGNRTRGLSRFRSLLSQLGLQDRLVEHPDQITMAQLEVEIDWPRINALCQQHCAWGRQFLSENLRRVTS
jgi:hypothetical protein